MKHRSWRALSFNSPLSVSVVGPLLPLWTVEECLWEKLTNYGEEASHSTKSLHNIIKIIHYIFAFRCFCFGFHSSTLLFGQSQQFRLQSSKITFLSYCWGRTTLFPKKLFVSHKNCFKSLVQNNLFSSKKLCFATAMPSPKHVSNDLFIQCYLCLLPKKYRR